MTTSNRDLSAEAPSAKVDRLDAAIDHVAARMVAVSHDGELTMRIATALPERRSRLRWLMPQLAAIGAIAIAAFVWTTRNNTAPAIATLPSAKHTPMTGLANAVAATEPGTAFRTLPLELLEPLERMEPPVRMSTGDHERALPPIEAVSALVVRDLAARELPATPALELAPIEITDLPLTAESFPPR